MVKFGYRKGANQISFKRLIDFNAIVNFVKKTTFVKWLVIIYAVILAFIALGVANAPEFLAPFASIGLFAGLLALIKMVYNYYTLGLAVGLRNITLKNIILFELVYMGITFVAVLFLPQFNPFLILLVGYFVGIGLIFAKQATYQDIALTIIVNIVLFAIIGLLVTGALVFRFDQITFGFQSLIG